MTLTVPASTLDYFGIDSLIDDDTRQLQAAVREFVDRPLESRGMRATEGFQTDGLTPGRSLGAAIRMQPREGAYLLLADIEEAETGDEGRVRQYLAKAVRAPRDPAWVADGLVSERWAPVSPVTGKLDAFEWRVPVERLGQLIEQDDQARHPSLAPPRPQPAAAEDAETEDDAKPIDGTEVITAEPASDVSEAEIIEETAPRPPEPARLPDDPGVDPSQEQEQSERRFRLF